MNNRPCVNKECEYWYDYDDDCASRCSWLTTETLQKEYCKKYITEPEDCPHLYTAGNGQLAIGACKKHKLVDMNCDTDCPDKQPVEPQEITINIEWVMNRLPDNWTYEDHLVENDYQFKCYEYDLPDGSVRYATIPIMLMKDLYKKGKGVELSTQVSNIRDYKTIRASRIVFERGENK